ncbi:MAG: hypothetical protein ACTHU0_29655 [Kofleriaceae bacterium]
MTVPSNAFDKLDIQLNIATDDPRNLDSQGGAGVAIQHGAHILYAMPDGGSYVTLLLNNLSEYQRTGRFEALNNWIKVSVKDQVPASMRDACKAECALSIAALGDYVYVFWRSAGNQHRVLRTRPDQITHIEIATISVAKTSENGNATISSNLAAFPLPTARPSLAGKIGVVALVNLPDSRTDLIARVLDPATFSARSTWHATAPSDTAIALGSLTNYKHLTAGWIDQGRATLAPNEVPTPAVSLVINAHNIVGESPSILSYGMDLLATFDPTFRSETGAIARASNIPGLESAGSLGATLYNTPDGQLWTKFTKDCKTRSAKLALDTTPASDPAHGKPGLHNPRWQPTDDYQGHQIQAKAYNTPFTVFLPLTPTVGSSPCKVLPPRDKNGTTGPSRTYNNCTIQTFIECVLASDENHMPRMSTFMWGQTFRIPDYISTTLVPEKQGIVQLTMVADTFPVPVPSTDLWGSDSPSGMVNWAITSYEYLVGNETAVELDYELSTSFGNKSSGNLNIFGIGVQNEASLAAGFSTLASEVQQTCRASSLTVTTKGTPPALAAGPDDQRLNIAFEGAYFGMTPPTRVGVDAYLVLPRGATEPGDVVEVGVHPDLTDTASVTRNGDYPTYCYTPGNLLTYDPGAINNRMRSLFEGLSASVKQRFVIDGKDLGRLYTRGHYIDDIVKNFGSNSFGPSGGQPYLEFSFSETAIRRTEFQSTSSFTEGGTTFVDASWYTGLGWNQTLSHTFVIPGIVEFSADVFSSSGFIMYGTQFSSRVGSRDTASSTWGLRLGEYLNPLAPGESYTVRMYLLKPSPLWALEMALFGGASPEIDVANSAPVRILFTVPHISDALRQRLTKTLRL